MKKQDKRNIFFDLDGTLHKQDLFGCYLRFSLTRQPKNMLLVVPLFPLVILGLLLCGRAARWPMSLLLWAITAGQSEATLLRQDADFCCWFRQRVTPFPRVIQRLNEYLQASDTRVWLITGSPQSLVEQVYQQSDFLPAVNLIATRMERRFGGRVLTLRCLGHEKVTQLEKRMGHPLALFSGYSDSRQDNPLLSFCQHRWRITPGGEMQRIR
ncbi:phosphatidylglycerophosphatase C [Tatumella sp. JGM118]|uniref:phosphatidylglycerophosphatase C n=1 Tax=Tatumella sp. JGM118 TaxID=2799796 RepID=UPI001BAF5542|nr:phosphatidylglycerophosphatase C [Tatumella sp. JGM118]MBS0909012.1 acid phosphatase AphA [Tatumella sp. JGM118]